MSDGVNESVSDTLVREAELLKLLNSQESIMNWKLKVFIPNIYFGCMLTVQNFVNIL